MATVYLGLGSNIEPVRHLRFGLAELEKRFGRLEASSVYRSGAFGFDGDDFLNLVVGFETDISPQSLQRQIEAIHRAAGRDPRERGYSSRTLDIDLLLYDDLVTDDPPIPRADILRFSFVLGPLAEIAPELVHPETQRTIGAHWKEMDRDRHPITRADVIL